MREQTLLLASRADTGKQWDGGGFLLRIYIMGVINYITIAPSSYCRLAANSASRAEHSMSILSLEGLQMWYCKTRLWHNLKFCKLGALNHHYFFKSAWRYTDTQSVIMQNICKTLSIILTLCGKFLWHIIWKFHATPSFLPTDQSFQTIDFANLAWCNNCRADWLGVSHEQ